MASAPNAAELVSTMTNQITERAAIRPARAWSAPDTTPVISKAMISGMTVIFSASSHSPPTVEATVISGCADAVTRLVGQGAEQQADDQRAKHQPGGALAAGLHCGFRNLKMKRSVLPADLGVEHVAGCDRRPGFCSRSLSPSSTKPARRKSAFTTAGSIRWSFSTTARVSPPGVAIWSMMPTIAPGFAAA